MFLMMQSPQYDRINSEVIAKNAKGASVSEASIEY